jgi:ABC-2 type transport system permease protein
MRIIDLALKDLKQIVRDRKSAIFLVLMPVVFTAFFGAFVSFAPDDTRLKIGVLDQDHGAALSVGLQDLLAASSALNPVAVEPAKLALAQEDVRSGKLAALVVIPSGFTQKNLGGQHTPVQITVDTSAGAASTAQQAIQASLGRIESAVTTARLAATELETKSPFPNADDERAYLIDIATKTLQAWKTAKAGVVTETTGETITVPNGYSHSSPGIMAQFVIFGLTSSATLLVLERKSQTLKRLLTTSMHPRDVVAGKVLAMFLVTLLQEAILVAVGQIAFHVDYLREPLATLLLMVGLALFAANLGLLIGVIAKSEQHASALGLIAMFAFSALGGVWFPLEITGKTFSAIGHLTPLAWAIDGFQNILIRSLGLSSVALPIGVLMVYGALCFGLAVRRIRYE